MHDVAMTEAATSSCIGATEACGGQKCIRRGARSRYSGRVMNEPLLSPHARYALQAERLRRHFAKLGMPLDAEAARFAVSRLHGADGWESLLASAHDAAPECFNISVLGSEGIVAEHVYAFGLAGAMAVMLGRVRNLLRNHAFSAVKAAPDAARLLILDFVSADAYARISLEHGPVHDAAKFVEVSAAIATHASDAVRALSYVVAEATRMRETIRPLRELPYTERLVEACRDALENDASAALHAHAVLDLERLARGGKLMWRHSLAEVQDLVPALARLGVDQAAKVVSAAALALAFHGDGLEEVAYGQEGLRIRPAEKMRAPRAATPSATLH